MESNRIVGCFLFLILNQFKFVTALDWICTEDVCVEYLLQTNCPKIDEDCRNATKGIILPSLSICNCCDYCLKFLEEGDECLIGAPGDTFPQIMCGPNLQCSKSTIASSKPTCNKLNSPSGYDPDFFPGYTCDKNNKCNCAVIEGNTVQTIFGEFKKTKDTDNEKQCECSIAAYKAKNQFLKEFPFRDTYMASSRCLPNGQYDPLQCMGNSCVCVDKQTGEWDKTIPVVAPIFILNVDKPSCFDASIHKPGEYFSECELERAALLEDKLAAQQQGFKIIYGKTVNCNPDGSYADVNA